MLFAAGWRIFTVGKFCLSCSEERRKKPHDLQLYPWLRLRFSLKITEFRKKVHLPRAQI